MGVFAAREGTASATAGSDAADGVGTDGEGGGVADSTAEPQATKTSPTSAVRQLTLDAGVYELERIVGG
jgi:hypothetical protein